MKFNEKIDVNDWKKLCKLVYPKKVDVFIYVIVGIYALSSIVCLHEKDMERFYRLIFGGLFILLFFIIMKKIRNRRTINMFIERTNNNEVCEYKYIFGENSVETESDTGIKKNMSYSSIKKCIENEEFFVIVTKGFQTINFKKQHQEESRLNELKTLLKSKGVRV